MFEQKFLAYVLYITLVEIRNEAYEKGNNRLFWLADLLHNVPFSMLNEDLAKEQYSNLLESVKHLKIDEWLQAREKEFYDRHPEYGNIRENQ